MLDFDSEVFVWMGSKVPKDKMVNCFKYVGQCTRAVSCKGKRRLERISFAITYQGYEPEIFKNAFHHWVPFNREGIDDVDAISEGDESNSESSDEEKKNKTNDGASTAAATNVGSLQLADFTAD